jgi:hypothetical protein
MKQLKTKFKWKINAKWGTLHSYLSCVRGVSKGYGLDGRGWIPGRGKIFLFSTASRPVLGPTQPPIQWVPGTLSPGVKRSGREAEIKSELQKDEQEQARINEAIKDKFQAKNKYEVGYTPFLSLLCPWRLDGLRAGRPGLDSRQG